MHYCTSTMKMLSTDWFTIKTNANIRRMSVRDLTIAYQHIDRFFEAHLKDWTNPVGVARNCPSPWPPALAPVWHAAGMDEQEAAMFLGNLYCRHAIARPELWWSFSDTVIPGRPRRYIVQHHLIKPHTMED